MDIFEGRLFNFIFDSVEYVVEKKEKRIMVENIEIEKKKYFFKFLMKIFFVFLM